MEKNIVLTGFWPPTNEMLRPFSKNIESNNSTPWQGENWRGLGYNIYSYFPEFSDFILDQKPEGSGFFQVNYDSVFKDLKWVMEKHNPVAVISFGKGKGAPWELELHAPDHWNLGLPAGVSTLPLMDIQKKIEETPGFPENFVQIDKTGDAGNFVCGYTALQLSQYKEIKASGFIHVNTELPLAKKALEKTLESLIEYLQKDDSKMKRTSNEIRL